MAQIKNELNPITMMMDVMLLASLLAALFVTALLRKSLKLCVNKFAALIIFFPIVITKLIICL